MLLFLSRNEYYTWEIHTANVVRADEKTNVYVTVAT